MTEKKKISKRLPDNGEGRSHGATSADGRGDRVVNPLAASIQRLSRKIWTCTVRLEVGRDGRGWVPCEGSHQGGTVTTVTLPSVLLTVFHCAGT